MPQQESHPVESQSDENKYTVPYEVCTLCDGKDRLVVLFASDTKHARSRFDEEYRRHAHPTERIESIKKVKPQYAQA